MSFLEELATRKRSLKPAETRVTTCTGAQYVEPRSEIHSNAKQSFSGRPPNLILQPTACSGYVVDEKPDLQVGQVTENLLIGSADAAMDTQLLQDLTVTHILTVAPMEHYRPPVAAKHTCLNILDLPETDLSQYYSDAFTFIDDAVASGGRVLVHCNAGVSRSAAITLAYLMKSHTLSYEDAWLLLKAKRPSINPNFGFILQLKNYERQLTEVTKDELMA